MAQTNPDGTITVQAGDTLSGIYGSDWQSQSGYTGDPTKLQIGTVLPAPSSGTSNPAPLPSAIDSNQLAPKETPTIPTGTNTPNTYVPPNLAGAPLQSLTQSEQDALNAKDSGANNLVALYGSLTGESKALTDAYNSEDITGLKKTLQDYNNQILTKTAELQQYDVQDQQYQANIEKQAVPLGVVVGQQAEQARQSAITRSSKVAEIGLLNSQVLATQGNIELATKTAEEAVAAKYAPIKEQIAIQEAQLKAIEPLLTTAEKKIADNQQLAVDTYKEKLKTQEELSLYNAKLGIDNAAINSGVAGYSPTAQSSYTIKSSDLSAPYSELYSVAKAAGVDLQTLKDLNPGLVEGKIKAGDVVNLPVAGSTKDLGGAIQSIATSIVQKNLRTQFLNQATALSRSNNVVGLKDLLFKTAASTLPSGESAKMYNRYQMLNGLNGLAQALQDYKDAGGNTSLLSGGIQATKEKLGKVGDPTLNAIGRRIANFYDEVVRYRTGSALNTGEEAFYKKLLPSIWRSYDANQAGIQGLQNSLTDYIDGSLGFALGSQGVDAFLKIPGGLYSGASDNKVLSQYGVGGDTSTTDYGNTDDLLGEFGL